MAKIYKVYLLYETGSRNIDLLLSMIPEPSHDLSLPRERIVEVNLFRVLPSLSPSLSRAAYPTAKNLSRSITDR